jgi:hypothetical protein
MWKTKKSIFHCPIQGAMGVAGFLEINWMLWPKKKPSCCGPLFGTKAHGGGENPTRLNGRLQGRLPFVGQRGAVGVSQIGPVPQRHVALL